MAKVKIKDIIAAELEQFLPEQELELYNVEFIKEGKDWFLRVYIDKPMNAGEEYISTDECELVSRFLSERLDELDPIEQNYYLEVSSPGLDRALIKEQDYIRYKGRIVEISLYKAIDGKKNYEGILEGLIDDNIVIKDDKNNEITLALSQVAKTKLAVVF